jgi:hypothetical protein
VERLESVLADVPIPAQGDPLDPRRRKHAHVLHQPRKRALVLGKAIPLSV